jgi:ribosomal protein S18 acetylase RimI-like enzyme
MPPLQYTTEIQLRDGRKATVRPLEPTDVEPLTAYFQSLSPETRRRYGPHPFDRVTAEKLCASINNAAIVRFIAVLDDAPDQVGGAAPEVVGYMILSREIWPDDQKRYGTRLREGECACFAPSIADVYQNQGIGTQMGRHVLASAKEMGIRQVILMGGVQATNDRARHLYAKLGFHEVSDFWVHLGGQDIFNYDMALEL